jgi:hypothetical protein
VTLGSWLGGLFGGARSSAAVDAAVERIVQVVNPRLKLVRRYRARLAPAVERSLDYVNQLVAAIPPIRAASVAAWSADPYLCAFFGSAKDLARAFSRSADVRAYFERNAAATEVCAVLGMEMTERRVLGMGLAGDAVRGDVEQTTLSFSDHGLRVCAGTEEELRAELARRLMEQLAIEGLGRAANDQSRRQELAQERALLQARAKILERQGAGMGALAGTAAAPAESAKIGAELERNAEELRQLAGGAQPLEQELERAREVLENPADYLHVSSRRLRLDRMNVVQKSDSSDGAELELELARVPGNPPRTRAFALVRFPRADLLPPGQGMEEAARLLA